LDYHVYVWYIAKPVHAFVVSCARPLLRWSTDRFRDELQRVLNTAAARVVLNRRKNDLGLT